MPGHSLQEKGLDSIIQIETGKLQFLLDVQGTMLESLSTYVPQLPKAPLTGGEFLKFVNNTFFQTRMLPSMLPALFLYAEASINLLCLQSHWHHDKLSLSAWKTAEGNTQGTYCRCCC